MTPRVLDIAISRLSEPLYGGEDGGQRARKARDPIRVETLRTPFDAWALSLAHSTVTAARVLARDASAFVGINGGQDRREIVVDVLPVHN